MATRAVRFDLIGRDLASPAFDRVGKKMGVLEATSARVGRALKAGLMIGAAAIGAIGVVSVKSAVDFQSAMTKISTQAGGSAKDVKALSAQVLSLGGKVEQGPQQLAEALYHLKSVGMDNVDAMKALRTASDLAAVGGADLEDTTNALAGAWRTGIKGATSFSQAAATVNSIIGAGNMTMADFTEALSSGILPAAKTFGLSLQQVGAALALFTDEGVPASDAATRLRMSISLLGAASPAADKQLKTIGLTSLDLNKAMRGPNGIIGAIQLLKDHLDASGLSAAQQSQLLSRAFGGGRSSAGILALINNLDVLKQKQAQVNSGTSKYADAVKQQRQTAEAEWKRLESALQSGSVRLGTALLPPLTSFVSYLNDKILPALGKVGSHIGSLIPMSQLKADLGDAAGFIGDFLKGLTGISSTPTQKLPSPALKTPPVPALLARPESDAQKFGETIRTVGAQLAKDLKPLAASALGIAKAFATIVIKTPAPVFTAIVDAIVATAITKKVIGLATAFRGLATAEALTGMRAPLAVGGLILLAGGFDKLGKLWAGIKFIFRPGKGGLIDTINSSLFGKDRWNPKWFTDAGSWVRSVGKNIIDGIVQGAQDEWHSWTSWFSTDLPNALVGWVEQGFQIHSPSKLMMPAGANIIRGLLAGALGVADTIGDWLSAHVKLPVLGSFAGVGSWLTSKGSGLISGFRSGADSVAKSIGSWMTGHVVNPVKSIFSGAGGWLPGRGSSLISGFESGAGSIARSIGGWLSAHVVNPVKGRFSGTGGWLRSDGGSLVAGLKAGISDQIKGIGGWIQKYFVNPIVSWTRTHFGINSPSKVFMSIGQSLTKGLVMGMAKTHPKEIAQKVFGSLPAALGGFVKHGLISAKDLGAKALKALGGLGGDILGALGLGDSSVSGSAQQFAQLAMKIYGWGPDQWPALKALWQRESGWSYTATNPSSGAYGIPQSLPASKMASAGSDWRTNPDTQIRWGLGYIKSRYGSPADAWAHETRFNWYDSGGYLPPGPSLVMNGTGRKEPTAVFTKDQWDTLHALAAGAGSGGHFEGQLVLDSGELLGVIKGTVEPMIKASQSRQAYRARVGRRTG